MVAATVRTSMARCRYSDCRNTIAVKRIRSCKWHPVSRISMAAPPQHLLHPAFSPRRTTVT